ncbi:FmdB family regulatory protein [Thauera sp. 63]|nr:FmdB family regulatory protein [Thauera sp. 63]
MSDEPLSSCPSCGATGYAKLLSAAGFQLKGTGWYATDFKGGSTASSPSTDSSPSSAPACAGGGCACH